MQSAPLPLNSSGHCSPSPVPRKNHNKHRADRACLLVQKRRQARGRSDTHAGPLCYPGLMLAPSTLLRALSPVQGPSPRVENCCCISDLMVRLTPEAFQAARDLLSFPIPPTPVGHLPPPSSDSSKEQGVSGVFLALGPWASSRDELHFIPGSQTPACQRSPEPWPPSGGGSGYCSTVVVENPLWSPKGILCIAKRSPSVPSLHPTELWCHPLVGMWPAGCWPML